MKISRSQLRRYLLKEMIALPYGEDKRIATQELAQQYETYARINKLPKKQRFAILHDMTMGLASTPNEVKNLNSNVFRSLRSPLAAAGAKVVKGRPSTTSEGTGYYVQATNSRLTTSGAINNQSLGPSNQTAPSNDYNGKFQANQTGMIQMLQACMKNANLANNAGERCEIGLAMILALINGGEYIAFTGSEAGADVKKVGSDTIYELKYSQTSGEINTMYSASPPSVSKTNKYYVFLTDERSYVISSPLLAQLAAVSGETPESLDAEGIKAYEEDLLYYIDELPEFFDTLYAATKSSEFAEDKPLLNELIQNVIDKINLSEIAISICAKLIGINDLPAANPGQVVRDKANIVRSPAPTTEEYQEAIQDAREEFIGTDGKIKSYTDMRQGQKNRFRNVINGMLQVSGAEQRIDSVTLGTPQIGIGGKGTPLYKMRKTSGTTPGGGAFSADLKREDLSNSVKIAIIAGKTNEPNYPITLNREILNNFITGNYQTYLLDPRTGGRLQARYVRGEEAGQPRYKNDGSPIYVEVSLIGEIKKDTKALDELLKELLRNPVVFDRVFQNSSRILMKIRETDIFGLSPDDPLSITSADDGYFEMWAAEQPEFINNPNYLQELIDSAKNMQKTSVANAFILYTNYPRPIEKASLDLELYEELFVNNSTNYPNVVKKAEDFVIANIPSGQNNLLVTLLKRYAVEERRAYKFNESKVYKKVLKSLLAMTIME